MIYMQCITSLYVNIYIYRNTTEYNKYYMYCITHLNLSLDQPIWTLQVVYPQCWMVSLPDPKMELTKMFGYCVDLGHGQLYSYPWYWLYWLQILRCGIPFARIFRSIWALNWKPQGCAVFTGCGRWRYRKGVRRCGATVSLKKDFPKHEIAQSVVFAHYAHFAMVSFSWIQVWVRCNEAFWDISMFSALKEGNLAQDALAMTLWQGTSQPLIATTAVVKHGNLLPSDLL